MKSQTNSLTAAVIKFLSLQHNFRVWRQNQVAAPGRKFVGVLGLPDVIGYNRKTGQFIAVEIKAGYDKLSIAQIEFGINVLEGGALWWRAQDIGSFMNAFEFGMKAQTPELLKARILILKQERDEMILKASKRKRK